jgi:hypothetical protein
MATDLNFCPENCAKAVTLRNYRGAGPSNLTRHGTIGEKDPAFTEICHCGVKKCQTSATWLTVPQRTGLGQSYKEANPAGNLNILYYGIVLAEPVVARLMGMCRETIYIFFNINWLLVIGAIRQPIRLKFVFESLKVTQE